jgi:2-polyprenyl-6-methoxyphenol hydroxylase-like FAD-dependent oxidoreductase
MDSQVLIIGAGPVGLMMAIELGRRAINVLLVDKRSGFGKLPKMERCNARTMENPPYRYIRTNPRSRP